MAKKSNETRKAQQDRRALAAAMKRAAQAEEKRKNLIIAGVCILTAGALIAVPVFIALNKKDAPDEVADTGAPAAAAGCDAVLTDEASGGSQHVGAGVRVDYAQVPASSGKHFEFPATVISRGFYTDEDRPSIEQLVHNLEHGYTIAWYLPDLPDSATADLEELSGVLRRDNSTAKFIAAPWDAARGAFPEGKAVALAHWGGSGKAYRQFCSTVSGGAVAGFMNTYPSTDAPEPNTP